MAINGNSHQLEKVAVVLLIGLDEERRGVAQTILRGRSIETRTCTEQTFVDHLVQDARPLAFVFVGLQELAKGVRVIERLAERGVVTIVGAQGLETWTIGQRSLVLASGATRLIDTQESEWYRRLIDCILELHRKSQRQ